VYLYERSSFSLLIGEIEHPLMVLRREVLKSMELRRVLPTIMLLLIAVQRKDG
jgi:hypothetical protein